jgi:predicted outer membrane repeat protein
MQRSALTARIVRSPPIGIGQTLKLELQIRYSEGDLDIRVHGGVWLRPRINKSLPGTISRLPPGKAGAAMLFIRRHVIVVAAAAISSMAGAGTIRYVDDDAPPGGDGLTWDTAFSDLQDALDAAISTDAIWVAAGTYRPDRGTGNRTAAFELRNRITVYGGFAGDETSLDQRDWAANVTTLTGDLNGDDGPDFTNYEENSYNVVRVYLYAGVGTDRLDGFVITGGNADGDERPYSTGGGLYHEVGDFLHFLTIANCRIVRNLGAGTGGGYLRHGTVDIIDSEFRENVSLGDHGGGLSKVITVLSLTGCSFIDNEAAEHGGAIYASSFGHLAMDDCRFLGNVAGFSGGGVYAHGIIVTGTNCTFESNDASTFNPYSYGDGGGLFVDGSLVELVRCRFLNNTARLSGGGAWLDPNGASRIELCEFRGNVAVQEDGGGLWFISDEDDSFVNCLFTGNAAAERGGGMRFNWYGDLLDRIVNCTFAGNTAGTSGGLDGPELAGLVANSVFWANSDDAGSGETSQLTMAAGGLRYSCVQGWTGAFGGVGNHGLDPNFVDMDGVDDIPGNADDDLRLQPGSPCIDAADNTAVPTDAMDVDGDGDIDERLPVDLAGNPRFADDPATPDTGVPDGLHPIVDMGAYEYSCPWDLDGDGAVGVTDFLDLLALWGSDPGGPPDFDGDGEVGITDFLILLANWGPCP